MEEQKNRERVNAKQKASGEWYFDVTVECFDGSSPNPRLVELAIETRDSYKNRGFTVV